MAIVRSGRTMSPKSPWLSSKSAFEISNKEWELASKYLLGCKNHQCLLLLRANKRQSSELQEEQLRFLKKNFGEQGAKELQQLKHSFINIEGKLFVLFPQSEEKDISPSDDPAFIGVGSSSYVRYAKDQKGVDYIVKIEVVDKSLICQTAEATIKRFELDRALVEKKLVQEKKAHFKNELMALKELGVEVYTSLQRNDREPSTRYIVMPYLGESLINQVRLPQQRQLAINLEISIKLAMHIHALHRGWLSVYKRAIAHHDLKPENITLDPKGRIHLIDLGLAKVGVNLDKPCKTKKGTSRYSPPNAEHYSHRQKDSIALARVIYLPQKIHLMNGFGVATTLKRPDDFPCLLSDSFVKRHQLVGKGELIDVLGQGEPSPDKTIATPLFIAASLALASLKVPIRQELSLREKLLNHPKKQEAVVVLFLSRQLEKLTGKLASVFDNETVVNSLSKLAPQAEKRLQSLTKKVGLVVNSEW